MYRTILWGDTITLLFYLLSAGCFATALSFLYIARKHTKHATQTRTHHHIPQGKITYTDLNKPNKPLYSRRYHLAGKPDYIIQTPDGIIPVEYKSGAHTTPKKNHILQLAAYCHLIEEHTRTFVPYGMLVYDQQNHKIPFNPQLRFELETTIKEMQKSHHHNTIQLNHNEPHKCKHCSIQQYCTLKLH